MQRNRFAEMYTWIWAGLAVVGRVVLNALRFHNFAPVGPVSLFAGARIGLVRGLLTSLGMMVATDMTLYLLSGMDSRYFIVHWSRPIVYASFMCYTLLGWALVGEKNSVWRIGLAAVLGETQFFLITNFAAWVGNPNYPQDLAGLISSYEAGLAFTKWTLAAQPLFVAAIFGIYALLPKPEADTETATAHSRELEISQTH